MVIRLGALHTAMEQYDTARQLLLEAEETSRRVWGREHKMTQFAAYHLVLLYKAWNKPDEAAKWRAKLPEPANAVEQN